MITWEHIYTDKLSSLYTGTYQGYTVFKTVFYHYLTHTNTVSFTIERYQAKLTGTFKCVASAPTLTELFDKLGLTPKEQTLFT